MGRTKSQIQWDLDYAREKWSNMLNAERTLAHLIEVCENIDFSLKCLDRSSQAIRSKAEKSEIPGLTNFLLSFEETLEKEGKISSKIYLSNKNYLDYLNNHIKKFDDAMEQAAKLVDKYKKELEDYKEK
jgi:hypothetical protein